MNSTDLSDEDNAWLDGGGPFPESITVETTSQGLLTFDIDERDERGHVMSVAGRRGRKGFVLFVRDPDSGVQYAAKLCLMSDYEGNDKLVSELRYSAKLKNAGPLFAAPHFAGRISRFEGQPSTATHWACFIVERVEGKTVKHWVQNNPHQITPDLVCDIARDLVSATLYLVSKRLKHDDLHWGNLMLRPKDPDLYRGRSDQPDFSLTIVDTGSLKPLDQETAKPHDDWARVVKVLAQLHNAIHQNRLVACRYPRFLSSLSHYCKNLLESDKSRFFPTDDSYYEAIDKMALELRFPTALSTPIFEPFDAISAEHLASDNLLLDLFVEALPWMGVVCTARPTVLSGPRGCGKSMLMRYLGAKAHLASPDSTASFLERIPFLGVYVSCSSDLQSDVLWLARDTEKAVNKSAQICTLFSLLLARELFRLFDRLLHLQNAADQLGLTLQHVTDYVSFCREYMPSGDPVPRLRVSTIAGDFADELDGLRRRVSRRLPFNDPDGPNLPQSFISELISRVVKSLPELASRPIVFLLDDYTSHRIPKVVQKILNPIVFSRQSGHLFKVSCEKFGFTPATTSGLRIDPDREYEWTDAGAYVLDIATDIQKRDFIAALLDARLKEAGYRGTAGTLIGDSVHKHDTDLARHIRSAKVGRSHHYNGLDVLANLWSGDIATILHMVRSMFHRAAVTKATVARISDQHQHEAIRAVSQGISRQVQHYFPHGPQMYRILTEFGQMASELLTTGPQDPGKKAPTPQRKYRLEMTKKGVYDLVERLGEVKPGDLDALARELLRRAVFIDIGPSRGKESKSSETVRWQLRSSLLPSFGLSLVRHNYIDIKDLEEFVILLSDPERFRRIFQAKYSREADLFDQASTT